MTKLDDKDTAILQARIAAWDARQGARVGDYVRMLDGTLRRFTHDWDDAIQTTIGAAHHDQSFYLGNTGRMSFSGSLDSAIPKTQLVNLGETLTGSAWFFHHDYAKAHNGITVQVPCRVFGQVQA